MTETLKAACIQINAGPVLQDNIEKTAHFIEDAAAQGAQLVLTPENTGSMRYARADKLGDAFAQDEHPVITRFSALSERLGITLVIGSVSVQAPDGKMFNRSVVCAPDGAVRAVYDKIHLFDVQLPTGEVHTESDAMVSGSKGAVVRMGTTPFALGLSVCYDLRFAYLYRALAQAGANILCVPAAFTVPTGQAHWEVLLRARAIETGSYVLAAAQVGTHEGGRATYGHSMIVDPWGRILTQKEAGEGIILADLNSSAVESARSAIPALTHDRTCEVCLYE